MNDTKSRKCMSCNGDEPLAVRGGKVHPRCEACHKAHRAKVAAKCRRNKKIELANQPEVSPGWKVCTKCYTLKRFSEFRTVRSRPTKVCDACLTSIYAVPSRVSAGFDAGFWRKRAYTCNTTARVTLAKRLGVPVASVKLTDLDYICKPQDLQNIFNDQDGGCFYCNEPLVADGTTTVDHSQAQCNEGAHHPENFRISCCDCNHLKFKRGEQEFLRFLQRFIKRDFRVTEQPDKEPVG